MTATGMQERNLTPVLAVHPQEERWALRVNPSRYCVTSIE